MELPQLWWSALRVARELYDAFIETQDRDYPPWDRISGPVKMSWIEFAWVEIQKEAA